MNTIGVRPLVAPILIGGMAAVLVFDAIGAAASKQFGFSYALLIPGSLLIYGVVAALVARRRDWIVGVLAALAMALTDLTLGWAVSWWIGPGKPAGGFTVATIIGAVITAFVGAGIAGSVGAWLGIRSVRNAGVSSAA